MGERLFITFALTGRSSGFYVTQGVALGLELAGLSARAGPQKKTSPLLCEQSELQCFAPPFSPVPAMSLPCRRFAAEGNATLGRE